jgi:hypothetical protein
MDRYIPVRRLANLAALALGVITLSSCGGGSGGGSSGGGGSPPIAITTQSLPAGQVGTPYTTTLSASGGTAPYAWSLGSGTLPSGLSLNSDSGLLAGYPSAAVAAAALNFKVTDSSSPAQSKTAMLPLTIAPAQVQIGNTSLPNGQVNVPYSVTLNAAGGTPPYTWKVTPNPPFPWAGFNSATGVLSGTPTAAATATPLTFEVLDSGNPQQTNTAILSLTILPPPLVVTTTSLPCGQVGATYNFNLLASGGTGPYTWTLASGSLDGLTLAAGGAIAGMPAATLTAGPVTFQVTDAGNPQQTANVAMTLTVGAAGTLVCLQPARAALTVTQTLKVKASTNDASGVSWAMNPAGGSISPGTSTNGEVVTVTAPATAGVYTLTATSVGSGAQASLTIGVTDLPAVATWHNDLSHTGVNAQEYALTTATVTTATFGKLFSCPVDGAVYAQPLWIANLMVGGAPHNVVIVATQHDSVYAFDADDSSCQEVWPHVSLIDGAHGGTAGEIPVPSLPGCYNGPNGNDCYVGQGYFDIQPEVGVTGTPVIDPPSVTDATGTIYVVSKSVVPMGTPATSAFYQRLHALDLTTGMELSNAPETIAASYPGGHAGGTTVTFSARQQNQRPALALVNGTVYIAWGSHEDTAPYYGWVMGYSYGALGFTQTGVYNATPNAGNGGIWMAGAAPAADANGNLYVIVSNGQFDVTNTAAPNNDYGDSFLQLTPGAAGLTVSSYFTPADQETDFTADGDAGSGGAAVVLNLPAGGSSPQHLVVGGGKDGTVFVLNGDNMGGYVANGSNANAWQSFPLYVPPARVAIFSSGAFWNNTYYLAAAGSALLAFPFDTTALTFSTGAVTAAGGTTYKSPEAFGFPGATPSISASGAASNGLVWALSTSTYCTNDSSGCGPAILRAYDAGNLGNEVWNSKLVTGDAAGNAVKFTLPTVANGKVYVGTRGNNSGGADGAPKAIDGQLDVYGLKPN